MTLVSIIFLIIVSTLTTHNSRASTDSLMVRILGLEREIMRQKDPKLTVTLLLEKTQLYQNAEEYEQAVLTLDRIGLNQIDSSNRCLYYHLKTLNHFLNGSYNQALYSMRSLSNLCHDFSRDESILKLSVLLEMEQWEEFKEAYLSKIRINKHIDSSAFISDFDIPDWKDPLKYKRMSSILPGLGLLKSGETKKGTINLMLNLASLGFAGYNFYYGFYATSVFSGLFNVRRFYNGGKNLTVSSIERQNEEEIAEMKRVGYQYLQKLY